MCPALGDYHYRYFVIRNSIVNYRFLQRAQKQSCRNQLIHRCVTIFITVVVKVIVINHLHCGRLRFWRMEIISLDSIM